MQDLIRLINSGLSLLTLIAGIGFVFLLAGHFSKSLRSWPIIKHLHAFTSEKALLSAFTISLVATLGSLFFSEVAGYNPCKLCWLQRIFMYPLPIMLGLALRKKDVSVIRYVLPLSVIGGLIAGYHYLLQIQKLIAPASEVIAPCSVVGYSPSCSSHFILDYGYITIPMMAVTAFALIVLILFRARKERQA